MQEVRKAASRGDLKNARSIAAQIANYRRISEKSVDAGIVIATTTQAMVSNHKIHRAQIEAIKGISFANAYHGPFVVQERVMKYTERMVSLST